MAGPEGSTEPSLDPQMPPSADQNAEPSLAPDLSNVAGASDRARSSWYADMKNYSGGQAPPSRVAQALSDRAVWADYNRREAEAAELIRQHPETYQLDKPGWTGVPKLAPIQFQNWTPGAGTSPMSDAARSISQTPQERDNISVNAEVLDKILSSYEPITFDRLREICGFLNSMSPAQIDEIRQRIDTKHQQKGFFDENMSNFNFYGSKSALVDRHTIYVERMPPSVPDDKRLIQSLTDKKEHAVIMNDDWTIQGYEPTKLKEFMASRTKGYREGSIAPYLFYSVDGMGTCEPLMLLALQGLNDYQKAREMEAFVALPQNKKHEDFRAWVKGNGGWFDGEIKPGSPQYVELSKLINFDDDKFRIGTSGIVDENLLIDYSVRGLAEVLGSETVDVMRLNRFLNRLSADQLRKVDERLRAEYGDKGPASDKNRMSLGISSLLDRLEIDRGQRKQNPAGLAKRPIYGTLDGSDALSEEQIRLIESYLRTKKDGYDKGRSVGNFMTGINAPISTGWFGGVTRGETFPLLIMATDGLTPEQAAEVYEGVKADSSNSGHLGAGEFFKQKTGDTSARVQLVESLFKPETTRTNNGVTTFSSRIDDEADLWVAQKLCDERGFAPAQCENFLEWMPLHREAAAKLGWDIELEIAHTWVESAFVEDAVASVNPATGQASNASGPKQFQPSTGRRYGLSGADRFDPKKAIPASAEYRLDIQRGLGLPAGSERDIDATLAAYYKGEGAIGTTLAGAPADAVEYVQTVRRYEARVRALYQEYYQLKAEGKIDPKDIALIQERFSSTEKPAAVPAA